MGTSEGYFEHYRYARTESLELAAGGVFDDVFDAVLGAEVAERLGYALGDSLVVAHGAGDVSFVEHDDKPFRVSGILAPTGTPVDRTVHVSLEGYTAMHVDWKAGAPIPGARVTADEARAMDLTPVTITAFLVGLESKIAIFGVQRRINEYREEPLLAIIPGVALQELWDLMSVAENLLRVVSSMVVVTGLLGMLTVILSSLEARRREMAVLRSVGARPLHVFALFMSEAGVLALLGAAAGVVLLYVSLLIGQPRRRPRARPARADCDARARGLVDHRGGGAGWLPGRRRSGLSRLPAVACRRAFDEDLNMHAGRRRGFGAPATAATLGLSIGLAVVLAALGPPVAAQDQVRDLEWEELMPEDWDPLADLEALFGEDVQNLSDNSAKAIELFNAYQESVRSAPVVGELDGQKVRLPGFVVPLDFEGTEISEFLLVPYFGACIHVPPPPSNQIVYVTTVAAYPLQGAVRPGVGDRRAPHRGASE